MGERFVPGMPLDEHGLVASQQLADGRWLTVSPLLFGRAQLAVTRDAAATVGAALDVAEFGSYADVWHYETLEAALAAMAEWAGREGQDEPEGWQVHPTSGRRRSADGTIREGAR